MNDDPTMTPAQREWQRQSRARYDADRRVFNNACAFWRDCEEPRCRREHACSGDPHGCFQRRWALIPEDAKMWFRAALKALVAGASFDEADRIGEAEMERWRALEPMDIARRPMAESA